MIDKIQKLLAAATAKRNDEMNNLLIDVGLAASEYASLAPLRKGARHETISRRLSVKSRFVKALVNMRNYSKTREDFADIAELAEEMRKEMVIVRKEK